MCFQRSCHRSKAEKEKNRITTGTLTWENIDNKAEYKTGGHGISYNGKIGRGDKNDPLDSQTNNRYRKDTITGQRKPETGHRETKQEHRRQPEQT